MTAGFVNAALFAERIALGDWAGMRVIALWMFLFLAGALTSSLIVSRIGRNQRYSYVIPVVVEMMILLLVALEGHRLTGTFTDLGIELAEWWERAGAGAERTGTGRMSKERAVLRGKIRLWLVIIFFFMGGALGGAYLFRQGRFLAFWAPAAVLVYVLFYDVFRIRMTRMYRKWRSAAAEEAS